MDRITASAFGVRAADMLAGGATGQMVAWSRRGLEEVPLAEIVGRAHGMEMGDPLLATVRGLGICLGD